MWFCEGDASLRLGVATAAVGSQPVRRGIDTERVAASVNARASADGRHYYRFMESIGHHYVRTSIIPAGNMWGNIRYAFLTLFVLTALGLVASGAVAADDTNADAPNVVTATNEAAVTGAYGDFQYSIIDSEVCITGYAGHGGNVVIPSEIDGMPVTSIGDSVFYYRSLTSAIIPDTVTAIGNSTFYACTSLDWVSIPSVTTIGDSTFYGCNSLFRIIFPDNVTSIGDSAFRGCSSLTSISFPSVVSVGDNAFSGCYKLNSINLPNVKSVGAGAFSSCTALYSINLPNVTTIDGGAFNGCNNLASIEVSEDNKEYSSIDGVLYSKDMTVLLLCPEGKSWQFAIPDSVTTIGDYAFEGCGSLSSVVISDSTTSIGDYAFYDCYNLDTLKFMGDAPTCGLAWAPYSNPDLTVYFSDGASGYTTPTWLGIPSYRMAALDAPQNLEANVNGNNVYLTWSAPPVGDRAPVLYYETLFKISGDDGPWIKSSSYAYGWITGLEGGKVYSVGVRAVNIAGTSEISSIDVQIRKVPDAPEIVATAGDGEVLLSWAELLAPENGLANIEQYIVYQDGVKIAQTTNTTLLVTGLINGQPYSFNVSAQNSMGIGSNCTVVSMPKAISDILDEAKKGGSGDNIVLLAAEPPFSALVAVAALMLRRNG